MTTALLWILTPILIIDCLFLGLLVIVQLPKKEAGVGMAFGGGATDALFGAGSGNALTKLTKYCSGLFFALVLMLCLLNIRVHNSSSSDLENKLRQTTAAPQSVPAGGSDAGSAAAVPGFQGLSNMPAAPAQTMPTPAEAPVTSNAPASPAK